MELFVAQANAMVGGRMPDCVESEGGDHHRGDVRMQAGRAERLDEWNSRIERGPVHMSTVTRLETGFAVRSDEAIAVWQARQMASIQALSDSDRRTVARWALVCAERVVPLFGS